MRHIVLKFAAAAAALCIGAFSIGATAPDDPAAAPIVYQPATPTIQLAQYYGDRYYGDRSYAHCYQVCVRRDYYGHCISWRRVCE